MRKETHTVYSGLKGIGSAVARLRKTNPGLFKRSAIEKLPAALFESAVKATPGITDEGRAFLLYFTGNMTEFLNGEYAGPDKDRAEAASAAYDGMKAADSAVAYLMENKPELFEEENAARVPEEITGFLAEMKYKLSDDARKFLEEFLGFVTFNLTKGFVELDPKNPRKPSQMELF